MRSTYNFNAHISNFINLQLKHHILHFYNLIIIYNNKHAIKFYRKPMIPHTKGWSLDLSFIGSCAPLFPFVYTCEVCCILAERC